MLYILPLVFGIMSCISLMKGNIDIFFKMMILSGIFSISATIDSIYQRNIERQNVMMKAASKSLSEFGEKIKKDMTKEEKH